MKTQILAIVSGLLLTSSVVFAGLYLDQARKNEETETVEVNEEEEQPAESMAASEDAVVTDLSVVDASDHVALSDTIDSLPTEELSQAEIDGLLLMREEEKLAHDVYTTLYEQWGQNIFQNIAKSEQTHTDAVADLLVKYEIDDPVASDEVGAFTNTALDQLYDQLVAQGSASLTDALTVGALVEDLDIQDLADLMLETDNQDILTVYQNLQKGSRNHLRSFTRVLGRNGETYTPSYISEELYAEIIGSASENGVEYGASGGWQGGR